LYPEGKRLQVEIRFAHRELGSLCNSKTALMRRWGPERGAVVAQRLAELQALDRLADLAHLPHIEVAPGADGTAAAAGADLVIIVKQRASRPTAPERLTVLAVEERREED
jgi:hypothetical protein